MSGTASASIVGVKRCSSPRVGSSVVREREAEPVHELERVLAHHDEQLRLHDAQLARAASRRPAPSSQPANFTQFVP